MRCAAATCTAVRQPAASVPAGHCRLAGSKAHLRGSSITPSVTPSIASQAPTTAWLSSCDLAVVRAVGSLRYGMLFHSSAAIRWAHCQAGAPATMPS